MPKYERRIEINAPVETLWMVMTNPNLWPKWFADIREVSHLTAVRRDVTFTWRARGQTGYGTIGRADPHKRLEIAIERGGDRELHFFEIQARRGFLGLGSSRECWVEYTLDTLLGDGILSGLRADGNPEDMLRVRKALERLKELAEGQTRQTRSGEKGRT